MTKIAKIFCIALVLLLAGLPAAAQRRGYVISPVNGESVLHESAVRASVDWLTDPAGGGRATGTPGGLRTARWLAGQFQAVGLQPLGADYLQELRTETGQKGWNVIGRVPGKGTPQQFVLVMAHFDNLGVLNGTLYPGADSNASGVAALLELGRMFVRMSEVGKTYSQGLLLVALDGKEQSLGGARAFLKSVEEGAFIHPFTGVPLTLADISQVVNLDQLGSTLAPITKGQPNYLLMLSEPGAPRQRAMAVNQARNLELELAYDYYGSKDFTKLFYRRISDHCPFLEKGIPSVLFTSGITLNNNKPYDDAASLDYPVLTRRIRFIFYYLDKSL